MAASLEREEWKADDGAVIARRDRFEERDTARFEAVAAAALEGTVGIDIAGDLLRRQGAHGELGDLEVLVDFGAVHDRHRGHEAMTIASEATQLRDGGGARAGFSQHLAAMHGDLIAADDDVVRPLPSDALGLGSGEVGGQLLGRSVVLERLFVDCRRYCLEGDAGTREEVAAVARGAGEDDHQRHDAADPPPIESDR